jgi:hypothetical protein
MDKNIKRPSKMAPNPENSGKNIAVRKKFDKLKKGYNLLAVLVYTLLYLFLGFEASNIFLGSVIIWKILGRAQVF